MDLSQVLRTAILTLVRRVVASEKENATLYNPMANLLRNVLSALLVPLVLTGCGTAQSPTTTPQIKNPYLGQEPPGTEPFVCAPGIVSEALPLKLGLGNGQQS